MKKIFDLMKLEETKLTARQRKTEILVDVAVAIWFMNLTLATAYFHLVGVIG